MQAVKLFLPAVLIGSIVSFVLYFQWTVREISSYSFVQNTLSESADCSIQKSSGELDNIGSAKRLPKNVKMITLVWHMNGKMVQAVYYKNMTIGNSCKSSYSNGAHKATYTCY